MQLNIDSQNLYLGKKIQEHVERQINFALGQFDSWITRLNVHLEDVNGEQKHGVDKQCRILVGIKGGKTIKIQEMDTSLIAAIDQAADRVGHAVAREIERRKDRKTSVKIPEYVEV